MLKLSSQDPRKKMVLNALWENKGLIFIALKKCGVSAFLHNEWLLHDREYRDEVTLVKEHLRDAVEARLLQNIEAQDQRAIEFWLCANARNRGYCKTGIPQEQERNDEVPSWMRELHTLPLTDEQVAEREKNNIGEEF
jgi:hypothetical protein